VARVRRCAVHDHTPQNDNSQGQSNNQGEKH
jgi:hypothetical protein